MLIDRSLRICGIANQFLHHWSHWLPMCYHHLLICQGTTYPRWAKLIHNIVSMYTGNDSPSCPETTSKCAGTFCITIGRSTFLLYHKKAPVSIYSMETDSPCTSGGIPHWISCCATWGGSKGEDLVFFSISTVHPKCHPLRTSLPGPD